MSSIEERYSIWGVDKLVYGPVDRETLLRWTRDGRVTSETWVHDKQIDFWLQGEKIDFIKPKLAKHEGKTIRVGASPDADKEEVKLTPDSLRSFELFSELSDHKLEQIIMFSSIRKFAKNHPAFSHLLTREKESGNWCLAKLPLPAGGPQRGRTHDSQEAMKRNLNYRFNNVPESKSPPARAAGASPCCICNEET